MAGRVSQVSGEAGNDAAVTASDLVRLSSCAQLSDAVLGLVHGVRARNELCTTISSQ